MAVRRVVLLEDGAARAKRRGCSVRAVDPVDVDDLGDVAVDAADLNALAERASVAGALAGDRDDGRDVRQRALGGWRERRESVRGGDGVVADEGLLQRVLDGRS